MRGFRDYRDKEEEEEVIWLLFSFLGGFKGSGFLNFCSIWFRREIFSEILWVFVDMSWNIFRDGMFLERRDGKYFLRKGIFEDGVGIFLEMK